MSFSVTHNSIVDSVRFHETVHKNCFEMKKCIRFSSFFTNEEFTLELPFYVKSKQITKIVYLFILKIFWLLTDPKVLVLTLDTVTKVILLYHTSKNLLSMHTTDELRTNNT